MGSRVGWYASVLFASVLASSATAAAESAKFDHEASSLVIVLGGDLGFGGSGQPIHAKGGYRHGNLLAWKDLTKGVAPLLTGHLNFANLESVVTDKRKLVSAEKLFTFQMHANGLRHLVDTGFNVLSTANNHSRDFGQLGMRETLRHLKSLKPNGLLAAPGLGAGRRAAIAPALIKLEGVDIAISAVGIGGTQPGRKSNRIGQPSYNSAVDFNETVAALAATKADYRILSAHYGRELSLRPAPSAVRKLRDQAVMKHGADLVVGHHTHVAAGVQRVGQRIILYGLGNLLHLGMQDMTKFGHCRDFGLLVRLHLQRDADNGLRPAAIEAIPLTRMHSIARPLTGAAARKRIAVLNGLANELDDQTSGARGLRFKVNSDGRGVYCFAHPDGKRRPEHPLCRQDVHQLLDVAAVRCGRLSKSIVARSSRNRIDRRKRRNRRTAGLSVRKEQGFSKQFFRSVYGR